MIVGVAPYDAKEVTTIIEKHITEPFPEPVDRNPNIKVSKTTIAILRKMMAKKPEDRYGSWKEFEQAVNNVFSSSVNAAVKTQTQRNPYHPPAPAKKNKIDTVTAIVNSLILIVVALIAAYFIYEYKKNSAAERNVKTAEQYYSGKPVDFNEALRLFSIAKETAIGTKYFPYAARRYDEVLAKANAFKLKADNFDVTYKKAYALFTKRKFQEAIELLVSVKEIEDPVRKQDAEKFIIQIRAAQSPSQPAKGK